MGQIFSIFDDTKEAIIFDSGTGESKILYISCPSNGTVKVKELKVLLSLKGLHTSDKKESETKLIVDSFNEAKAQYPRAKCVVGLTAWFRDKKTSDEEKQFTLDIFANNFTDVKVLQLQADKEALMEATAVNYAAEKSGIGKPNLQLAAGGGSINIVYQNTPFGVDMGFRAGMTVLMEHGLIRLGDLERTAKENFDEFFKTNGDKFPEKTITGTIIAISACYYAAKGCKIAKEEAVTASEVCKVFTQRLSVLVGGIGEGEKPEKKVAQEISNMVMQKEMFGRLCAPDAQIYFRRDWKLDGEDFRTTWSSGYFIDNME